MVWETATGKLVAELPEGIPDGASPIAFSCDGRFLATAGKPEGVILLWEVATWSPITSFTGHRDRLTSLAFMPNGRLLSGSLDTTVLAWDTRPPRIMTGSLDTAWSDLDKHASDVEFKAEGRFLATPADAVKFFDEKIQPAGEADGKKDKKLTPEQVRQMRVVYVLELINDEESKKL